MIGDKNDTPVEFYYEQEFVKRLEEMFDKYEEQGDLKAQIIVLKAFNAFCKTMSFIAQGIPPKLKEIK